jgi:hypothetical protein
MRWVDTTSFPKVFKLRRGSGSDHVKLVESKKHARQLIRKAFGSGFPQYDASANLKERWRKFRLGKNSLYDVLKGVVRLGYTTNFSRVVGNEKGYAYFQDFIPNNDHDIRVNVVDGKAFAVRRNVRDGDFRASGSGYIFYEKHHFPEEMVELALDVAKRLKLQAVAFDFLQYERKYLIAELSYGFCDMTHGCTGYWDSEMTWHEGKFREEDWMVDTLLKKKRVKAEI